MKISNFIEQDGHIWMIGKNATNRLRNFRRRKTSRCHLVKQRLAQVVIGAIHQRDARIGMLKVLAKSQSSKTPSQNHYTRSLVLHKALFIRSAKNAMVDTPIMSVGVKKTDNLKKPTEPTL